MVEHTGLSDFSANLIIDEVATAIVRKVDMAGEEGYYGIGILCNSCPRQKSACYRNMLVQATLSTIAMIAMEN